MLRFLLSRVCFTLLLFILLLPGVSFANQFDIAHIREQGQDIIIIPLDSSFNNKTLTQKNQIIFALQMCASSAGLEGRVVVMWFNKGSTMFIAPPEWHPFFNSIDMVWVARNINRSLTCN